ncbi:MAG: hypothetical protein M3295_00630 [Chloroflexota bacterium]|nr:hypothetical protein [Chloroflexota bacterium]
MSTAETALLSIVVFAVFAYHATGAAILTRGGAPLPQWFRATLPHPARGMARGLSMVWVSLVVVMSQWLIVVLLVRQREEGAAIEALPLLLELFFALVFTAYLVRIYRPSGG